MIYRDSLTQNIFIHFIENTDSDPIVSGASFFEFRISTLYF